MSTYHWNAEDYEKNSRSQQIWARELIEKLSLQGTENVLDLGCGDGKVTAEIARLVSAGSVIGIDSSRSMIELATVRYPSNSYANLSFMMMDASHLSFEECFDVVFSNAALHWVKNHKPVLDGVFKCLKPGGKILLQMGGKGNVLDILSVLDEMQSQPEWQPYFNNFEFPYGFPGVGEYEEILFASGFKATRVELIQKDMVHDGKLGLEGWIRTTWLPYIERIPEGMQALFIKAISARYIDRVPLDSNNKVHVAMVRIEVEAKKPSY